MKKITIIKVGKHQVEDTLLRSILDTPNAELKDDYLDIKESYLHDLSLHYASMIEDMLLECSIVSNTGNHTLKRLNTYIERLIEVNDMLCLAGEECDNRNL